MTLLHVRDTREHAPRLATTDATRNAARRVLPVGALAFEVCGHVGLVEANEPLADLERSEFAIGNEALDATHADAQGVGDLLFRQTALYGVLRAFGHVGSVPTSIGPCEPLERRDDTCPCVTRQNPPQYDNPQPKEAP